jgi:dTDP-4-amino-4,6-dideoxygalactose transaminase|tara:strand:- start:5640 stop:6341 length:702 start_codon:yes stop_codon:yes gene_type:complete
MKKIKYNIWPVGKLPKKWQRPELDQLKEAGYNWEDPRDAIDIFEKKVAKFAGSKYAVAIDCCSHGLFLCMKYLKCKDTITIPKHTYVSAPMQILHAGCKVEFEDLEWSGIYQFKPYPIWDGAVRWTKNMFVGGDALQVVSFQIKKRVPIGRGGIIMTNSKEAYDWLKYASYDGRDLNKYYADDDFKMVGWHFYMTPEDAARGILLMDQIPEVNEDTGHSNTYSDLSNKKIFKQ